MAEDIEELVDFLAAIHQQRLVVFTGTKATDGKSYRATDSDYARGVCCGGCCEMALCTGRGRQEGTLRLLQKRTVVW